VVESADLRHRHDIAVLGWLDNAWLRRVLLESEVCARGVVVAEVTAKTATQVSLVQNDHLIK
jgi:hypothetical protein